MHSTAPLNATYTSGGTSPGITAEAGTVALSKVSQSFFQDFDSCGQVLGERSESSLLVIMKEQEQVMARKQRM